MRVQVPPQKKCPVECVFFLSGVLINDNKHREALWKLFLHNPHEKLSVSTRALRVSHMCVSVGMSSVCRWAGFRNDARGRARADSSDARALSLAPLSFVWFSYSDKHSHHGVLRVGSGGCCITWAHVRSIASGERTRERAQHLWWFREDGGEPSAQTFLVCSLFRQHLWCALAGAHTFHVILHDNHYLWTVHTEIIFIN